MELLKSVACIICSSDNKWHNVDSYRHSDKFGMYMCMGCGFVSYPKTLENPENIKKFYDDEYRNAPNANVIFTAKRKLHYHDEFLGQDLFSKWKKEGKHPVIFESGSGIGMFLKYIKDNFPQADISGTELNEFNRRIAKHLHGIHLGETFDASKKYDFIMSYKVAEHVQNVHLELRQFAECLSPGGYLYISVPTWFHSMTNFGTNGFSLEYYYHRNHINVWSKTLFETLLRKCGLEVVKENQITYDSTYLCKRNDDLMLTNPSYEEPLKIMEIMDKIKKASMMFDQAKPDEALKIFPAYPEAWVNAYEMKKQVLHKQGFVVIHEEFLKKALSACPNSHSIVMFCADICMRYEQWDEAIKYINEASRYKPNDAAALIGLTSTLRMMAEKAASEEDRIRLYAEAFSYTSQLQRSPEHTTQAISWLLADASKIPVEMDIKTLAKKQVSLHVD